MIIILNKIWIFITLSSLVYSFFTGTDSALLEATLNAGGECISLMMTLLATMSFFTGLMKIAESAGITTKIAKFLSPFLRLLFPEIPKNHPSLGYISMNITANLLGMGNAATPLGVKAMKSLASLSADKKSATRAMNLFTVINTSSVQLIPTTVIALRMSYGSSSPFIITLPVLASGTAGLVAGIIAVNLSGRRYDLY